jgi:hypothetical protein
VHIAAHYKRDLKHTYRINARLRRRSRYIVKAIAALVLLLAAAAYWAGDHGEAVWYGSIGLVITFEFEAVLWLKLYLNRSVLTRDVEVTVTDDGVCRRTATDSLALSWPMIAEVIETSDGWIFRANRLQSVALRRAALTPLQHDELKAFLSR